MPAIEDRDALGIGRRHQTRAGRPDQPGDSTWMTRLAIISFVLAA
jgi:hypothetical protein